MPLKICPSGPICADTSADSALITKFDTSTLEWGVVRYKLADVFHPQSIYHLAPWKRRAKPSLRSWCSQFKIHYLIIYICSCSLKNILTFIFPRQQWNLRVRGALQPSQQLPAAQFQAVGAEGCCTSLQCRASPHPSPAVSHKASSIYMEE